MKRADSEARTREKRSGRRAEKLLGESVHHRRPAAILLHRSRFEIVAIEKLNQKEEEEEEEDSEPGKRAKPSLGQAKEVRIKRTRRETA